MDNKSIIDKIYDPDNEENIILYNENDEPVEFAQIAVIPLEERVFVILKPLDVVEGVADDEALVFEINEKDDETLKIVTDMSLAERVFDEYYKLLNEDW